VKPVTKGEGGTAVSYVMLEDDAKKNNKQKQDAKKQQKSSGEKEDMDANAEGDKKPPKDRSNYKCWSCNELGHLANSKLCPNYKKKKEAEDAADNATWQEYEASMYTTIGEETKIIEEHMVNNAVNENQEVVLTKILLDNQANISIVHPALLTNVQKSKKIIRVKGVGSVQLVVNQIGMLEGFFTVYVCEHTRANVLSFADVEDIDRITYQRKQAFIVHMGAGNLVFSRRQKLYVADWSMVATVAVTVRENEQLYMKDKVRRAKLAHDFVRNSGYPSLGEAVHILTDGNVRNIPEI
jgi:hypothetical protein